MKLRHHLILTAVLLVALTGCRGERTSMTGGYGSSVVAGQVVMQMRGESPAGVEVTVGGTGMATVLGEDGRFTFAGVPEVADFHFRRASDGLEASLRLETNGQFVIVELGKNGAVKGSRRRSAGRGTERLYQFEGLVRSATAEELVVYTSHKEEVTIALDAATVIRKGNTTLTAADLLADTRVHVKARHVEEVYTAAWVLVQNAGGDEEEDRPAVQEHEGVVLSSAADQLVIFDSHRQEVTFAVTAETIIRKGNLAIAPADLQQGWRVHVKATTGEDGAKTAALVIVQNLNETIRVSGTVTAVGDGELTIESGSGVLVIQSDESTRIEKKRTAITFDEIAVGDGVKVEGRRVDATTVLATLIEVKSK